MANPYDEVLYEGHPFAQTQPDRLGTIARLFGMCPAPPDACRVLELGCGDGGNLIPMAYTMPESQFLGIDAGRRGVEKGSALAKSLGLRNIELRHLDLLDADSSLGMFDYIVAHGVYSWVPPEVQAKILEICREHLNPQGVAYISYSAYPGGHLRTMVAEMLKYHARRFPEPERQIEQSRALLAFLASARVGDDGYALLLRQELETMAARRPATLFHDELARYNTPIYFREFAERASTQGLQYLGEADFFEMQDCGQTAEAKTMLRRLAPDLIEREQYLDFLKCRRFRQTLLCRQEVSLERRLRSEQMRDFAVSAPKSPRGAGAASPVTSHPIAGAMMGALTAVWPAALSFHELLEQVRAGAGTVAEDDLLLADIVLASFACGLVQLHLRPPRFAQTVSERPRASALARTQALATPMITNLCHNPVRMEDDWSRALVALLDGSRDRDALLADLREAAGERADEVLAEDLEQSLQGLAGHALLEA